MKKPEILAPAGDLKKLIFAVEYGADAVYIGGEDFSLRTAANNFSLADMLEGVNFAHEHNVKVYVACNIVARNDHVDSFPEYIRQLKALKVDGVIISDLGLFSMIREMAPEIEVHISTQANVTNYETCNFYHRMGAKRIVLARELSLDEIKHIRKMTDPSLELEVFVHGAMCMSHSGRCLLSNFMTGRDANLGSCTQPCRWKYSLMEEKRPGEYFPIEEDAHGSYILNSKDLCMIEHIPQLCAAGIDSLKIEGRVKSEYYVSAVTNAYRMALDDCFADLDKFQQNIKTYAEEVRKVSHREYCTGFFFGPPDADSHNYDSGGYTREYELVGIVQGYDSLRRRMHVTQRNKFLVGDVCEVLEPRRPPFEFIIERMTSKDGSELLAAPHAEMDVFIDMNKFVGKHAFVRRKKF